MIRCLLAFSPETSGFVGLGSSWGVSKRGVLGNDSRQCGGMYCCGLLCGKRFFFGPRERVPSAHSSASVISRRDAGVCMPTAFLSSLGRVRMTLFITTCSVTSLANSKQHAGQAGRKYSQIRSSGVLTSFWRCAKHGSRWCQSLVHTIHQPTLPGSFDREPSIGGWQVICYNQSR